MGWRKRPQRGQTAPCPVPGTVLLCPRKAAASGVTAWSLSDCSCPRSRATIHRTSARAALVSEVYGRGLRAFSGGSRLCNYLGTGSGPGVARSRWGARARNARRGSLPGPRKSEPALQLRALGASLLGRPHSPGFAGALLEASTCAHRPWRCSSANFLEDVAILI